MRDSKRLRPPPEKEGRKGEFGDFEELAYLNPIRDIFLFCCFSTLRHSDYKAMKSCIDIVDSIMASEMTKFDGLFIELYSFY